MARSSGRITSRGKYHSTRILIEKVQEFFAKGMNIMTIASDCQVSYRTVRKILMLDHETYTLEKPSYQSLYVIVSEQGLPKNLADGEVMDHFYEAMKGAWIHASAVEDAKLGNIRKRMAKMSDLYGQVFVAKLTFVDPQTFLETTDD